MSHGWTKRRFNACQTLRSMYTHLSSTVSHSKLIQPVSSKLAMVVAKTGGFRLFTCVQLYAEARLSYRLDVCLSVCPSVCLSHDGIVSKRLIVMLSSPHDSPFILVLCLSRSSRNSDGVTPCGAAKPRWGIKMSQFSTNNLLYLRNG